MSTIRRTLILLVAAAIVVAGAAPAGAQFLTIAPGGPSGFSGETVYGPPFLFPPTFPAAGAPGPTPILFAPPPPNPVAPPGSYIYDALSSGTEAGSLYSFSVAGGAAGLFGSAVAFEVAVGTAPSKTYPVAVPGAPLPPEPQGDIFFSPANFVTALPHPVFGLPGAAGAVPPGTLTAADEFTLGLNVMDDLSAVMFRVPVGGVFYYSLGAGGLGLGPFAPADIISSMLVAPWAPALALSLDSLGPGTDDIDALIIQDISPMAGYVPGVDFVAFSLTPASLTLGIIGPGYSPGGGDLLVPDGPDFDLLPDIFIPAAGFGLAMGDNLDAIDVVPEPGTLVLLITSGVGLLLFAWRRRK